MIGRAKAALKRRMRLAGGVDELLAQHRELTAQLANLRADVAARLDGIGEAQVAAHVEASAAQEARYHELASQIGELRRDLRARISQVSAASTRELNEVRESIAVDREVRRIQLDRIPDLRGKLAEARQRPDYELAYTDPEPLVSVRIASYQRTRQLVEVALPSVLAQTYQHLDVVVVNDGPNERTREAIAALGDRRVRYFELPERGDYPNHPKSQWRVAGIPAGNLGTEMAEGRWIAALDEDDEFASDHIARLLDLARIESAELVYGALLRHNLSDGTQEVIWSPPPPQRGGFSFQGAMYHAGLSFFSYEPLAWTIHEAGDWNLVRRMTLAGVRIAATEDIVGTLHTVRLADKATHPWSQPS